MKNILTWQMLQDLQGDLIYLREASRFGNSLVLFNQPIIKPDKLRRKAPLIAGSSVPKKNILQK